jgi:hypothetical protein
MKFLESDATITFIHSLPKSIDITAAECTHFILINTKITIPNKLFTDVLDIFLIYYLFTAIEREPLLPLDQVQSSQQFLPFNQFLDYLTIRKFKKNPPITPTE